MFLGAASECMSLARFVSLTLTHRTVIEEPLVPLGSSAEDELK
jgi:hypothetical protein